MTDASRRPRHAPGAPRMPFVLLVLGLIGGGMLALLALNTASAANEVRRHDVAERDQSVAAQVEQLQIDARNSAAPGNLARAAAALGMVPAGNPGFIEIGRSGAVRVLGRAAPATAPPVYVPPSPTNHHPNGTHERKTHHKPKQDKTDKTHQNKKKQHQQKNGGDRKPGTRGGAHHAAAPPSPTNTPTPTITLPGGGR